MVLEVLDEVLSICGSKTTHELCSRPDMLFRVDDADDDVADADYMAAGDGLRRPCA